MLLALTMAEIDAMRRSNMLRANRQMTTIVRMTARTDGSRAAMSETGLAGSSINGNAAEAAQAHFDSGKVLADVVFASGEGQRYTPTVLSLNRTAFARDDVVTGQIETLLYAFGGAFEVQPVQGLSVTELVKSSPNSMLVDDARATAAGQEATRGFEPGGKSLPLALRLAGTFRTAFPDGRPVEKSAKPRRGRPLSSRPRGLIDGMT